MKMINNSELQFWNDMKKYSTLSYIKLLNKFKWVEFLILRDTLNYFFNLKIIFKYIFSQYQGTSYLKNYNEFLLTHVQYIFIEYILCGRHSSLGTRVYQEQETQTISKIHILLDGDTSVFHLFTQLTLNDHLVHSRHYLDLGFSAER